MFGITIADIPSFIFEVVRAIIFLAILIFLFNKGKKEPQLHQRGWILILSGFALTSFGALIDITDHFSFLEKSIVFGRTAVEAFLEKVVGYLAGSILIFIGLWRWIPIIIKSFEVTRSLEKSKKELKKARDNLEKRVEERTLELAEANISLQESEEKFKSLAENNQDYIMRYDRECRHIYDNPAALRVLGFSEEDIIGKTHREAGFDEKLSAMFETKIRHVIETGESSQAIFEWESVAGKVYLDWRLYPEYDRHGEVKSVLGLSHDITDRKRAEVELQKAKEAAEAANQAKSSFLANMSHELRTPLNAILGYTQIFKRKPGLMEQDHKLGKGIETIHRSGKHLLMMINDILDLSKIEAGKMELEDTSFSLSDFLSSLVEMMAVKASEKGITFTFNKPSELGGNVQADETRLRQILLNLLGNAIKFTEKGTVCFTVERRLSGEIEGSKDNQASYFLFKVEDTGPGIYKEKLSEIFLPFHQVGDSRLRVEGTGLGLAISHKLIQLMKSELYVESIFGQGSSFWFELLLPETERVPESAEKLSTPVTGYRGQRRKIMIVDNDIDTRDILRSVLSPLGFEIATAIDGREGLEKTTDFHPDLILLDLVMPVMDGYEFVRALRVMPDLEDSRVIAISADATEQTKKDSLAAGCNDFLKKPLHINTLIERLQKHLKLDWIFQESPEKEPEAAAPLVFPPFADREALIGLAHQRNITDLRKEIKQLMEQNPAYVPFVSEVEQFLKKYQFGQLIEFIDSHQPE
ncbi:response regulator [candidate division CSSED10-310 bacterium]|uniref:histidine kinase n=1 Tax=candidate division CSSED10-310 bacterium TaxID=2855610 RepID=A0ABV6Z4I3_UNCC1